MNVIKKQAHDYELIATSWHEAGHVICGLFNFMNVYHVYIMSEKYDQGNTLYEIYDLRNLNNKLLSKVWSVYEVQTLYAGLVSEKMYYKEICGSDKFPMHLRIGSSGDMKEAARLINLHKLCNPGKERLLFKKQMQKVAATILSDYWDDVKLIAHVLYKNVELKIEDVKYILTRKSINKDFWKTRLKEIKVIYSLSNIDERYLKSVLIRNSVVII